MNNKTKIISNSLWQICFSILRAAIGMTCTAFIARSLGVEKYGSLQFIITVYFFLQLVEFSCHHSVVKKMLLEKKYKHELVLGSSFLLSLIMLTFFFVLFSLFFFFYFDSSQMVFALILCLLGVFARCFNPISWYFDSMLMSKKTSSSQFIGNLISNIARVFVVSVSKSLVAQALLYSSQFFVTAIIYIKQYQKFKNIFSWRGNRAIMLKILSDSLPLCLAAAVSVIFLKIDIIMLERILGPKDVGLYGVAVKLSEPWFMLAGALITSFFPGVIMAKSRSLRLYRYKLEKVNSILVLLGAIISITVYFFSGFLIKVVFGEEFILSAKILRIHIWSLTFLFMANFQQLWEVNESLTKFSLYKATCTSLLNIFLNWLLIPRFGGEGAAFSTLFSYFFHALIFNLFFKKPRFYLKVQLRSICAWRYFSKKDLMIIK